MEDHAMPIEAMWGLIGSISLLAFTLGIKIAQLTIRLKSSQDEENDLRSEIKFLYEQHNKEISEIQEFNIRTMDEFSENIDSKIRKFSIRLSNIEPKPKLEDFLVK
jgi:hypothetical protein